MTLIDIVYNSLLLFSSLFAGIIVISYISYKIKNRGKRIQPYSSSSNSGSPKEIIPKRNEFINTSIYSKGGINPKKYYHNNTTGTDLGKSGNFRRKKEKRYTKLEVINPTIQNNSQSKKPSFGAFGREKLSNFYSDNDKLGNYSLASANILQYYDDRNENEFYLFKTKY